MKARICCSSGTMGPCKELRIKENNHFEHIGSRILTFLFYCPLPAMSSLPSVDAHNHNVINSVESVILYPVLTLTSGCKYLTQPIGYE